MILIVIIAALGVWALIATVVELRRDGHRQIPTDGRFADDRTDHRR